VQAHPGKRSLHFIFRKSVEDTSDFYNDFFCPLHKNLAEYEIIGLVQATSPLVLPEFLEEAVEKMKCGDWDSVFSVKRSHSFLWTEAKGGELRSNVGIELFKDSELVEGVELFRELARPLSDKR
jgi:hypothetical protein